MHKPSHPPLGREGLRLLKLIFGGGLSGIVAKKERRMERSKGRWEEGKRKGGREGRRKETKREGKG